MSASSSVEEYKLAMAFFDSFSRTVMRRCREKFYRTQKYYKENEVVGTEMVQYVSDKYGQNDFYPSEYLIKDNYGHSCIITTEWLYQAMFNLPDKQKAVLILEFWCGLSRKETAEELFVLERTISNWKKAAFEFIRGYHKRNDVNGDEET